MMGLSSTAFEVVLGLFGKREDNKSYTFVPEAEQTPVLPGRETYPPISFSIAKERSTGKQIIQNVGCIRWATKVRDSNGKCTFIL